MSLETLSAGRYRIERTIGDGAMAKVLLAHDGELERLVAIKVLDERLAADASFRARFEREARVAAALSHPNIVTVYDVGEADGRPFIVMEYVEGRSLDERLRSNGAFRADEVVRVARQIAAGLEHAHENGLVHRDLKPGNLIQRRDGTIKIADFGIVHSVDATALTETGTIIGTAAYLAPEQAEGGAVTPRTDLFALGVVLYELLTGRQPWRVDSLAALAGRSEVSPPELPVGTPAGLRAAIERSLRPDPADRPASAEVVAQLLDAPADPTTVVLPPADRARELPRMLAPVAGAVLLALVGIVTALAVTRGGGDRARPPATTAGQVQAIPEGGSPSEDARNLAGWLRENARR